MIVGVVVYIGATSIFELAEKNLVGNFKANKLQQASSIAALIETFDTSSIDHYQAQKSSDYKKISNALLKGLNTEIVGAKIFTLNYHSDTGILSYAVDPKLASENGFQITHKNFDLLVETPSKGVVKLTNLYQHQLLLDDNLKITSNNQSIELYAFNQQLLKIDDITQNTINVNGKKLKLTNKPENIKLSDNNEDYVVINQVKKNSNIHLPGTIFSLTENKRKKLIDYLRQNKLTDFELVGLNNINETVFVAPYKNKNKSIHSYLIMTYPSSAIAIMNKELRNSVVLIFSFLAVALLLSAIFFARKITGPLEQLNIAIERLIHNDFNFKLSPSGFGSFKFIANQFNQMLAHIQKSRNELININKSNSRFVPLSLLKILGASSVNDINLGDCCEKEMTVLFCDIRGFTTLSESMTPQANFNFINRYLSQIAPAINKQGGVIDKYMGDGIMALFPNGADAAVTAANDMLIALNKYNQKLLQKKLPPIRVGVGIHSGRMMLGTVGTPVRMDATVVSDTVNAAARVESMTKAFSTQVLITEETKRKLKKLSSYKIRYIASCQIQGKSKPVTLYEIFDHDSTSLQLEKAANQPIMIKAWKQYKNGYREEAINLYQKLIEKSPNDKALFALIERCQSGRL